MKKICALAMLVAVALPLLLVMAPAAAAAGPSDIVVSTAYPWVSTAKGKTVTFPLEIVNTGKAYQQLDMQITGGPADWKSVFKDKDMEIHKVLVPPGKSQYFDFQANPPADAKASDYTFKLKAVGSDGSLLSDLDVKVSLQDQVSKGVTLSAQYPNLRGQAGSSFSFKLDLKNDSGQDRAVNFSANTPQDWEVTFAPSYDQKQISTLRMKAGDSQGLDVNVTAPRKVEAGDYNINVTATSGTDRSEAPLKVTVLGNFKLSLDTATGQLNSKATVDQDSTVSMVVRNTGASTLQNVTMSASSPDGWKATFNPEKIESIPPEQSREVAVTIHPGQRALAGDYMVHLTASGTNTSDTKDLRISVETPTTWGWAGIAAIIIVLGGLGYLFAKLSRR